MEIIVELDLSSYSNEQIHDLYKEGVITFDEFDQALRQREPTTNLITD